MKPYKLVLFGALIITVGVIASSFMIKNAPISTTNNKGFAVVELFTSEGCSSCPPADEIIAKLQKESADKPVYILAFHVDYWNHLGWKDIFSSSVYSHRQYQYLNWLHLQSVYTPQVIVNGKTELVGSEEGKLRNVIKNDLQISSIAQITLSNIVLNGNKAKLEYRIEGNAGNSVLLIALIQKNAQSKVLRGENSGHTLSHVQIVRSLESIPLKSNSGNTTITLPKGFTNNDYELIAFVQNNSNGAITGATKAAF